MKPVHIGLSLWLSCFSGLALTEAVEIQSPKCQKLAQEFSEHSDSLNEDQLKQLQFCVTQTLKQRYESNPPELLKGTIIEPPASSVETPATMPPPQNQGGQ
ncbi:MAG: hypothetical protein AB7P17_12655 [Nitrospirales bacterium]|nr:hypothetical protein [Nitrospirales bacterium]